MYNTTKKAITTMQNDFLSQRVLSALPAKRRRSPNGSVNFNCPMCLSRGQSRPDTKQRCGFATDPLGAIRINCFNCGFSTRWAPGNLLNKNVREFLKNLGVNELEIKKLNFTAWQLTHSVEGVANLTPSAVFAPKFDVRELPKDALPLSVWAVNDCDDPDFLAVSQYAMSRGDAVFDNYEFYWTPDRENGMNRRLIVPFFWREDIVGWTGRSVDAARQPRYYTDTPAHFLFNNVNLYRDRKYVILVEGIFDALSIDGVATQGAKLSEQQAYWLKEIGKQVIVLPDRDEKGQLMVDIALKHDFMVSFPNWDDGIKDANDAIKTYGRLWTVKTIIDGATDNKLKINLSRKKW